MTQPPLSSRITFIQPSDWVWHVWLDGRRVGTVNGGDLDGFVARDNSHRCVGDRCYSAEEAMQALVPVTG